MKDLKRFVVQWLTLSYLASCSAMDCQPGLVSYCLALAIVLGFALLVMRGI